MRHLQLRHLSVGFLFLCSCVSVNLGNKDVSRSTEVRLSEPSNSYVSIALKAADRAWQSKSTGTTLSYMSVCNDAADPSLEALRGSTLRGIEQLKIENEERPTYNGRDSLRTKASGSLDGIKVVIRTMIFKKNFCNYTISMVGLESRFSQNDENVFNVFLEGFVAP